MFNNSHRSTELKHNSSTKQKTNIATQKQLQYYYFFKPIAQNKSTKLSPPLLEAPGAVSPVLTALLSHGHHGVVADQAGHEGQGAGPQVLDDGRHEGAGQGLLERLPSRGVLGLVAVRDDHAGDGLLREAERQRGAQQNPNCSARSAITASIRYLIENLLLVSNSFSTSCFPPILIELDQFTQPILILSATGLQHDG